MVKAISEIAIVGGGTAGWMAAVFLFSRLNGHPGKPPVRVSLVESPNVPTVGVGEATVPGMREMLRLLEIPETDFIERCNASFKLGVRFVDWDKRPNGSAGCYDHPFDGLGVSLQGVNPAYHYQRFGRNGSFANLGDALSPSTCLIDAGRGPKRSEQGDYDYAVGYAYHLDAGLFAAFLRDIAVGRGVRHILDDVDDVELNDAGDIAALQLRSRGRLPVELVIDCTGFRSRILQQALGEPFESYAGHLFNDRAVAVQIPHPDLAALPPCTRSTALGAGWVWRVPLYSRIGTGYVFSSAFRSDDAAIDEFLAHLGPEGAGAAPRVIPMRVGRARRSWVKNCVALGLSGGFVEPLESTAIFIIEFALRRLVTRFPDREIAPEIRDDFNRGMQGVYEEVRDFIALHYLTSNRRDTDYWRATQRDLQVSDRLRDRLERWRTRIPCESDFPQSYLFGFWSYLLVLFGKGFYDRTRFPQSEALSDQQWQRFAAWVAEEKAGLLRQLPSHFDLLNRLRFKANASAPGPVRAGAAPSRPTVALPGERLGVSISWKERPPDPKSPAAEAFRLEAGNLL